MKRGPIGRAAWNGLRRAAAVVLEELFSRSRLGRWINDGTPVGRPELRDITWLAGRAA
jgi:hypothetical protein